MGLLLHTLVKNLLIKISGFVFAERIGGKRYMCCMAEHVKDERDLGYSWIFNVLGYVPKQRVVDIKTISIKDQGLTNTCVFQSATVQKEADEGVPLSARFLVTQAKKKGRITGNGFSSLRLGQQTLLEVGTCRQEMLTEDEQNWDAYSDPSKLSYCAELDADQRKNKSFAQVVTKDDWLHALENNRIIHTGMPWRSSYNRNGGLTSPYILTLGKGIPLGGHAFVCTGFDLNKNLYKFQNSYSESYGDKGNFYVYINDWHRSGYVGYVSVDADVLNPSAKFYEGKDVKSANDPKIYRIVEGKKRHFPDEATYFYFGGKFSPASYTMIAGSLLRVFPEGPPMSKSDVKFIPDIGN